MSSPADRQPTGPPEVDNNPYIFIDNELVEYVHALTRRLNQPVKMPEPIIRADQPWEHVTYFTCNTWNVIYDPQDGKYKCWYEDWDWTVWRDRKYQDGAILLAVSDDGVHWEKPGFGVRKIDGRDTNIVLGRDEYGSVHAATVFLDQNEPDEKKRFKMIYKRHVTGGGKRAGLFGSEKITFDMASSPDGIHWTPIDENPLTIDTLDGDVLIANRDPITGKIIFMGRPGIWKGAAGVPDDTRFINRYHPAEPLGVSLKRQIWRADSEDGVNWSQAKLVLVPGEEDNLDNEFYGLNHFRVGRHMLGVLNIIHLVDNTMDIELVYSRDDGHTWQRPFRNIPYVVRGGDGAWDRLMVTCCSPPVNVGGETYFYHTGANNHHDWWIYPDMSPDVPERGNLQMVDYCLGLAKLRRDGFVTLDANVIEGNLCTKPFRRKGNKLIINAACKRDGYIAVEVQDIHGRSWGGFTREDCDLFSGDSTDQIVTWRGNADLTGVAKVLRLAVYMKNASLCSIRFE